jgi:hypothetical protein
MLTLLAFLTPTDVVAQEDAETIAALKAQLAELSARLDSLESKEKIRIETYQAPVNTPAPSASSPGWTDRIKWKGDFRYRHETIDAEFADEKRHRNRVRARPAMIASVDDAVEVGLGLATGGEDPTSSNQTLGNGFSSKNIRLDLAYFDWETELDGFSVIAGKYKNPLHRTGGNGLLWDSDLRPEGLIARYERAGWRFSGMFNWISESSGDDNLAFGGQVDWSTPIGENSKLLLGAGYYDLSSVEGREVPFDGDARGNSVDALNRYLYGYQDLELFGEFSFNAGQSPTKIFFNYVENLDAPEFEQGWAIGGTMNFKHGNRPWKLGYVYQDLEADAVFAMFTDSDFIGGGTDGKGHVFRGSYNLTDSVSFGGTLFINERGENQNAVAEDYNRLMLDVMFKY